VFETFNLSKLLSLLNQQNSPNDLLVFILISIIFWSITSLLLVQFAPTKYKVFKREMLLFFIVINVGLMFIGIVLTLAMVFFGLAWATHRPSQPNFSPVHFEEHISEFPIVYSQFQEGILTVEGEHSKEISSDAKIKSLRILYDSNAQGNIAKIKNFLSDNSDETRLYAFALIASFEKKLNTQIKELQSKIKRSKNTEEEKKYYYELAYTYWQFIFHGVASEKLSGFYTQKIENTLKNIDNQPNAFVLLGKINIFNQNYSQAEKNFEDAIALGLPKEAVFTFLAEIKFAQKKYNEVSNYISHELFKIDIRLKPIAETWIKS
jgi:hypothetical protein